jgi:hypothetical protein
MDPDAPPPLGKPVKCTTFVDTNLYHCQLSGRAVTGILQFFNGTPVDWYSKKQSTVHTATFGSKFIPAEADRYQSDHLYPQHTSLPWSCCRGENHPLR